MTKNRWLRWGFLLAAGLVLLFFFYSKDDHRKENQKKMGLESRISQSKLESSIREKNKVHTNVPLSPPQREKIDILKTEYFEKWDKPVPSRLTSNHPMLYFYLECLESEDEEISESAFELFVNSASGTEIDSLNVKYRNRDARYFSSLFASNFMTAVEDPQYLTGQRGLHKLVMALIPRLENEIQTESVIRILNYATANVYENKPPSWWGQSYENSKLAGIFNAIPEEEWMKRPE